MQVILIPGFNPSPYTGAGNNTYLILGREPILIDAATGRSEHLNALSDALSDARLANVVVTHGHVDHASGAERLASRWPEARFHKKPWPEQDTRYVVDWSAIGHNDLLPAGDTELRVVATPGHAPDHICLYEQGSRTLFCGDLVIQGQTVVIPGSRGGSLSSYLDSLTLVRELRPCRVLPAHGPEITDLSSLVDEILSHRTMREAQIVTQLQQGRMSIAELVDRIYDMLSDDLRAAACDSVLAHLVKLRDEGRAQERDDHWTLT